MIRDMGGERPAGRQPAGAMRFLSDERALETVEYAIIAGLIVSGLVVIILAIGNWVSRRMANLQKGLPGA
jgi:Flp pilus assembly pilin Flp